MVLGGLGRWWVVMLNCGEVLAPTSAVLVVLGVRGIDGRLCLIVGRFGWFLWVKHIN